jgi:DNA (cytosine-5)-methyltransferase 1
VLFADDAGPFPEACLRDDTFGFYWTEGLRGLGWAQDATPTFKGGSALGIPSPPAIWLADGQAGRKFVMPGVEDAEALQGFERGWTAAADEGKRNGPRWKLVGNAVTVGVAQWVAGRIMEPGSFDRESHRWSGKRGWPAAAWGEAGKVWTVEVSEFPTHAPYQHLRDVVDVDEARAVTHRSAAGFWSRLQQSNLGRHPGFREAIAEHVQVTHPGNELIPAAG